MTDHVDVEALTTDDYQMLASFRRELRRFLRFSEDAARIEGLTPAQHQLLLAIKGHPGPDAPSISQVANALQLRRHSAVELVGRAEANGLVSRTTDPADLRCSRLSVTAAGEHHLARLSMQHRAELRRSRHVMIDLLQSLDPASTDVPTLGAR